jgi:hypothetical protein
MPHIQALLTELYQQLAELDADSAEGTTLFLERCNMCNLPLMCRRF